MPSKENTSTGALFLWSLIFIIGITGWLFHIFYADQARAWRALLVNFNFWTPLACGMIVWPAIVIISQGVWAKSIHSIAFSSLYFAPISIIAFIVLWIGHSHWAGWLSHQNLSQGFWFNSNFVFIRDIIALLAIWILCAAFVIHSRKQSPSTLAGCLCFAYGVVFTLIALDMVMALDPHWFSTLFGAYFFVSGMYAALALWTILSILSGKASVEQRYDLAKLIVAVSLLTAYMMFSQLLPIWYEDFEAEVRFVLPRLTITQWRYISAILVATIYLGPLVLLLTRWAKRSRVFLACVSVLMLVSLWIERWWEVTPALGGKLVFGLSEASITAAFLSSFMIGVILFKKRDIIRK
jgi:hypothetical protein